MPKTPTEEERREALLAERREREKAAKERAAEAAELDAEPLRIMADCALKIKELTLTLEEQAKRLVGEGHNPVVMAFASGAGKIGLDRSMDAVIRAAPKTE